jgi:hypothetical protein
MVVDFIFVPSRFVFVFLKVYMYERDESSANGYASYPRQCLPVAYVVYRKKQPHTASEVALYHIHCVSHRQTQRNSGAYQTDVIDLTRDESDVSVPDEGTPRLTLPDIVNADQSEDNFFTAHFLLHVRSVVSFHSRQNVSSILQNGSPQSVFVPSSQLPSAAGVLPSISAVQGYPVFCSGVSNAVRAQSVSSGPSVPPQNSFQVPASRLMHTTGMTAQQSPVSRISLRDPNLLRPLHTNAATAVAHLPHDRNVCPAPAAPKSVPGFTSVPQFVTRLGSQTVSPVAQSSLPPFIRTNSTVVSTSTPRVPAEVPSALRSLPLLLRAPVAAAPVQQISPVNSIRFNLPTDVTTPAVVPLPQSMSNVRQYISFATAAQAFLPASHSVMISSQSPQSPLLFNLPPGFGVPMTTLSVPHSVSSAPNAGLSIGTFFTLPPAANSAPASSSVSAPIVIAPLEGDSRPDNSPRHMKSEVRTGRRNREIICIDIDPPAVDEPRQETHRAGNSTAENSLEQNNLSWMQHDESLASLLGGIVSCSTSDKADESVSQTASSGEHSLETDESTVNWMERDAALAGLLLDVISRKDQQPVGNSAGDNLTMSEPCYAQGAGENERLQTNVVDGVEGLQGASSRRVENATLSVAVTESCINAHSVADCSYSSSVASSAGGIDSVCNNVVNTVTITAASECIVSVANDSSGASANMSGTTSSTAQHSSVGTVTVHSSVAQDSPSVTTCETACSAISTSVGIIGTRNLVTKGSSCVTTTKTTYPVQSSSLVTAISMSSIAGQSGPCLFLSMPVIVTLPNNQTSNCDKCSTVIAANSVTAGNRSLFTGITSAASPCVDTPRLVSNSIPMESVAVQQSSAIPANSSDIAQGRVSQPFDVISVAHAVSGAPSEIVTKRAQTAERLTGTKRKMKSTDSRSDVPLKIVKPRKEKKKEQTLRDLLPKERISAATGQSANNKSSETSIKKSKQLPNIRTALDVVGEDESNKRPFELDWKQTLSPLVSTDVLASSDSALDLCDTVVYHLNKDGSVEVRMDEQPFITYINGVTGKRTTHRDFKLQAVLQLDFNSLELQSFEDIIESLTKLFGILKVVGNADGSCKVYAVHNGRAVECNLLSDKEPESVMQNEGDSKLTESATVSSLELNYFTDVSAANSGLSDVEPSDDEELPEPIEETCGLVISNVCTVVNNELCEADERVPVTASSSLSTSTDYQVIHARLTAGETSVVHNDSDTVKEAAVVGTSKHTDRALDCSQDFADSGLGDKSINVKLLPSDSNFRQKPSLSDKTVNLKTSRSDSETDQSSGETCLQVSQMSEVHRTDSSFGTPESRLSTDELPPNNSDSVQSAGQSAALIFANTSCNRGITDADASVAHVEASCEDDSVNCKTSDLLKVTDEGSVTLETENIAATSGTNLVLLASNDHHLESVTVSKPIGDRVEYVIPASDSKDALASCIAVSQPFKQVFGDSSSILVSSDQSPANELKVIKSSAVNRVARTTATAAIQLSAEPCQIHSEVMITDTESCKDDEEWFVDVSDCENDVDSPDCRRQFQNTGSAVKTTTSVTDYKQNESTKVSPDSTDSSCEELVSPVEASKLTSCEAENLSDSKFSMENYKAQEYADDLELELNLSDSRKSTQVAEISLKGIGLGIDDLHCNPDQLDGSDQLELEPVVQEKNASQLAESDLLLSESVSLTCRSSQLSDCGRTDVLPSSNTNQLVGSDQLELELVLPAGNTNQIAGRDILESELVSPLCNADPSVANKAVECEMAGVDGSFNIGKALTGKDGLASEPITPPFDTVQSTGNYRRESEPVSPIRSPSHFAESDQLVLEPVPPAGNENRLIECDIRETEYASPSSDTNQLATSDIRVSDLVSPLSSADPPIVSEAVECEMAGVDGSFNVGEALAEGVHLERVSPSSRGQSAGSEWSEVETVLPQNNANSVTESDRLELQQAVALSSANSVTLDVHPISPNWMHKADVETEWCLFQQSLSERDLCDLGLKQVNHFTGCDAFSPPVIETSISCQVTTDSATLGNSTMKDNKDRMELEDQTTNDQHSTSASSLSAHDLQLKSSTVKRPKRITLADYKNRKSRNEVCVVDKEVCEAAVNTFIESTPYGIAAGDGNVSAIRLRDTEIESNVFVDERRDSTNSDALVRNADQDAIRESSCTDTTLTDCTVSVDCDPNVPLDEGSAAANVSVSGLRHDEDENNIVDKRPDLSQNDRRTENYDVKPADQDVVCETSCTDFTVVHGMQSVDFDSSIKCSSDVPTAMNVSVSSILSLHDDVVDSNILVGQRLNLTKTDAQTENDSVKPAIQGSVSESGCTDSAVRSNIRSTDCDSGNILYSEKPCDDVSSGDRHVAPVDETDDVEMNVNESTGQFELVGPCSPDPCLSSNVNEVRGNILPDVASNSQVTGKKTAKKKKKKQAAKVAWKHTLIPLDAQPECYQDVRVKLPLCEIIKSNKPIDRRLLSKDDRTDYDILRTDGESSAVSWPIILPLVDEVNFSQYGDSFQEENEEFDVIAPKTKEYPSRVNSLDETSVDDADVLNRDVMTYDEDDVRKEASHRKNGPAAVGQERNGDEASADQGETGSEISHSSNVPFLELSNAAEITAVNLESSQCEDCEDTGQTDLAMGSAWNDGIEDGEIVEMETNEPDASNERQEILNAYASIGEVQCFDFKCKQTLREPDESPHEKFVIDRGLGTDGCRSVKKSLQTDITPQRSSSRNVSSLTAASDLTMNATVEGCTEKSDGVDGENVDPYPLRRVTDDLNLSLSDKMRPVITGTNLHLSEQDGGYGNDCIVRDEFGQDNVHVKFDGLNPSSSFTDGNQRSALQKNEIEMTTVELLKKDSPLQSGKGEPSGSRDNWKRNRKFNDIWQDISQSWSRMEMSRDADVFLPKAEGQKERCSRHHIRQTMSYFFNLPQTVRNERILSARQSLESTRQMARQELVFTDPKVGLGKVDHRNLERTRPLLAKQLKLEALLRKIRHSLQELDNNLLLNDLEAELQFFKNCELSRGQDQQCCLLLLASHVIYEEFSKQQLYDSCRFLFVLPNDLRLEDEVGRYTSVEGCLLFLDSWSLRRDVCFDLFCLRIEIEDVHHRMRPEDMSATSELQNDSVCRLGWLHSMRKKKLESVTCATIERLQMISDRLTMLLEWYK